MNKNKAFKKIRFRVNPFLADLLKCKSIYLNRVKTSTPVVGDKTVYDKETDTDLPLRVGMKTGEEYADNRPFIKTFEESLRARKDLSLIERKMLDYIYLSLEFETGDQFYLDVKGAMEWSKYKTMGTVYQAIDGLIEKEFISRNYKRGFYFINPLYFYKGEIKDKYKKLIEGLDDYNRQLKEDYNSVNEKVNVNIN